MADTLEALQRVVTGEADAVIDYEFNLMEKIQTGGIMQIQPAGKVDSSYGHAIAVRKDWPELFSVISTAMSQITPEERRILAQKWLQQQERPAGRNGDSNGSSSLWWNPYCFASLFPGSGRLR